MLAAMVGDEGGEVAAALVAGSAAFPAEQRLDVYRRGYRSRLVGCLRETYPGLRHALGDEAFEAFALDYLQAHPPSGYTLNALGARWPEHLESTRPEGERWPDFLVDLACLERTFHEVYDGEGVEGPAAVLRTRYPVARYLAAVRRGDDPPLPAPQASYVAVSRRDWVVTLTEIDASEYEAVSRRLSASEVVS
jgi:hypothetical protein